MNIFSKYPQIKQFLSIIFIAITIMIIPEPSFAFKFTPKVCREYNLGKNWYCGEEQDEGKNDTSTISAKDILNSNLAPEEKAIQINQLWETQRKRAVITGNPQEIKQFLETHYLIAEKGVGFARNVQDLIDSNPNLASSESYYKNAAEANSKKEEGLKILRSSSDRYGLVFVYSSDCGYCAKQMPIIMKFKQVYGFKVMGVTMGDQYFAGLDENITDPNIANDPLVKAWPTILLLDQKRPKKIFVAKGLTTFDDLEAKIVSRIKLRELEEE